jgi:hypothetical protein
MRARTVLGYFGPHRETLGAGQKDGGLPKLTQASKS